MAIYHFSAKVISRANGSSAVAAAAYRSASRLQDERLDRPHDFTNKAGVVHSEILAPEGTPEAWSDRERLWNAVEAGEVRKDAQLAREIEFAIPREMDQAQGIGLAHDFVQREFVDRGMVADLNVHWDIGPDGETKPHAHVMLSLREVGPGGFGTKAREWNRTDLLEHWREAWGEHVNERLAQLGIETRVDHRSFKDQGLALEPQDKIGPAGARSLDRGETAERAVEHRQIARRNGERIIQDPSIALSAITHQQATFTDHDLARFVHRHSDDKDQFDRALSAVKTSPQLVALGRDGRGRERFTSREMLQVEERLERSAGQLAARSGHGVSQTVQDRVLAVTAGRGFKLGKDQADAFRHVADGPDLSLVVGYAGSGKSAMLGIAREAWEASGYQVQGAALSGIAAESLEAGSTIPSRTVASLEHSWAQGRDQLTSRSVLVIDEAGMIGSRQMDRVMTAAQRAGAKVVLVGDAEQLQAIEAGAAFRALTERHGAADITEIRRQREAWQRYATRELATGRTAAAVDRYEAAGMVHAHETRALAREALVSGWDVARREAPDLSQIMLAHTRADVAELNLLARTRLREFGDQYGGGLGEDRLLQTERGARSFAVGDRIMFLRNERSLGVKNGALGTIERIEGSSLTVRLDSHEPVGAKTHQVQFDLKDYAYFDHGYASTIHKSQGVTVDRVHLLATDGLDRHAAYVGMSRHRQALAVHYGTDDFKDQQHLLRALGRERAQDTTLDYDRAFAERRGIEPRPFGGEIGVERRTAPSGRGIFANFTPRPMPERRAPVGPVRSMAEQEESVRAVRAYSRAVADVVKMREQSLPVLPHQEAALERAGEALAKSDLAAARDLRSALSRQPGLAARADRPEGLGEVLKAMVHEGRVRKDPTLRADRFVEDWKALSTRREALWGFEHARTRHVVDGQMKAMVQGLGRDAELAAVLNGRRKELGLRQPRERPHDLARALTQNLGLGLSR